MAPQRREDRPLYIFGIETSVFLPEIADYSNRPYMASWHSLRKPIISA